MSLKLAIPEMTEDFKEAVYEYLCSASWDFYELLRITGDWVLTCESSYKLNPGAGWESTSEAKEGLHRKTLDAFIPLLERGYSGGDFQHVLLNVYLDARMEAVMCGALPGVSEEDQPQSLPAFEAITVNTTDGRSYAFVGRFRRELETTNWHYYETEDDQLVHFNKKHMVRVTSPIPAGGFLK